jgi:hypothetical protein
MENPVMESQRLIETIQITTNLISLIAILIFFRNYYFDMDSMKRTVDETYYLIVSDLIINFGHIIIINSASSYNDEDSLFDVCKGQAFIVHFGIICSFIWANLQGVK